MGQLQNQASGGTVCFHSVSWKSDSVMRPSMIYLLEGEKPCGDTMHTRRQTAQDPESSPASSQLTEDA